MDSKLQQADEGKYQFLPKAPSFYTTGKYQFLPKAPSFYTTKFSDINFFP